MSSAAVPLFDPRETTLFSPWVDFLLAGGASMITILAVPMVGLLSPNALTTVLAIFVIGQFCLNFPHFAASYQLLYGGFRAAWHTGDSRLRQRYLRAAL